MSMAIAERGVYMKYGCKGRMSMSYEKYKEKRNQEKVCA